MNAPDEPGEPAAPEAAVDPKLVPPPVRQRGPRYWRRIWLMAVEQFYGDAAAAEKWMRSAWLPLGNHRPLDLVNSPEGRAQVLQELERLEHFKWEDKPRTAWSACRAFGRCEFNGELLFRGTEIPPAHLFYDLWRSETVNAFLQQHPGVTRPQVDEVFNFLILSLCDW